MVQDAAMEPLADALSDAPPDDVPSPVPGLCQAEYDAIAANIRWFSSLNTAQRAAVVARAKARMRAAMAREGVGEAGFGADLAPEGRGGDPPAPRQEAPPRRLRSGAVRPRACPG
jgi:hypothetical protein